jgi:hypothetical protein
VTLQDFFHETPGIAPFKKTGFESIHPIDRLTLHSLGIRYHNYDPGMTSFRVIKINLLKCVTSLPTRRLEPVPLQ